MGNPDLPSSIYVILTLCCQTNSSRAKTLELHIAERVAAELAALQKKEDDALESLRSEISSEPPSSADKTSSKSNAPRLLELPSAPPPGDVIAKEDARQSQSSAKVFEELEKLRKGLGERKKVRDMPRDVERAREELVACLRKNDRKPLDCWREVEAFKGSVGKMEEEFIGRVL
jgi:MICOS complex subunit MIC19